MRYEWVSEWVSRFASVPFHSSSISLAPHRRMPFAYFNFSPKPSVQFTELRPKNVQMIRRNLWSRKASWAISCSWRKKISLRWRYFCDKKYFAMLTEKGRKWIYKSSGEAFSGLSEWVFSQQVRRSDIVRGRVGVAIFFYFIHRSRMLCGAEIFSLLWKHIKIMSDGENSHKKRKF